jgi:dienelactone hydrolase
MRSCCNEGGSKKDMSGISRRRVVVVVVLACIIIAVLTTGLTAQGRILVKSALFIPSLIPGTSVQPIDWVTRSPHESSITFSSDGNSYTGDIYLPATKGLYPAMIVSLGVVTDMNDPRVINLAQALARMGVIAFVPFSPNLLQGQVKPEDVDLLVSAFQYLMSRNDVERQHVGFLGICVGASLSLAAAEDPGIAGQVDFVIWFDGCYRLDDLIASAITHSYTQDGTTVTWNPDPLTTEVVNNELASLAPDAAEQTVVVQRAVYGIHPDSATEAELSPMTRGILAVFDATSFQDAKARFDTLPSPAPQLEAALSPASHLDQVSVRRLYLMVSTDDNLVPPEETYELKQALHGSYTRYDKYSIFNHVDLNRLANPVESVPQLWSLYLQLHSIFASLR